MTNCMIHTYKERNETGKNLQHQKRIYHHFGFHKKGAPRRAPLANVDGKPADVNIQALEKAGLRDKVTVMVGGAPVTEEYAKLAGADHYAPDASFATRMAKKIVGAAQAAENAALTQAVELIDKTLKKG